MTTSPHPHNDHNNQFIRRSQILAAAERALDQRIARRRAMLAIAGAGAVASALFFAWLITPFKGSYHPAESDTSAHHQPIATLDPSPHTTPPAQRSWLATSAASGEWLLESAHAHDWMIGHAPDPDWLSATPSSLAIASDEEFEQLVAQNPEPESRGIIRINGKLLLTKNLHPNPSSTQPFNN
jgi:hypothetical protein